MSRSWKKHPAYQVITKGSKTLANRKLRRKVFNEIPNGNAYRKFTYSWDICDQADFKTLEQYIAWEHNWTHGGGLQYGHEQEPEDSLIENWFKFYKRK